MAINEECYLIVRNDKYRLPVAPPMTAAAAAKWLGVNRNFVYRAVHATLVYGDRMHCGGPQPMYHVIKVNEINENDY